MPKRTSESGKKTKKKASPALIVSRVLIGAGLALILFALAYEAANFPWQIWFKSDEELNAMELPDPPPPVFSENAVLYEPEDGGNGELPGSESLFEFPSFVEGDVIYTVLGYLKIPKLGLSVNIMDGCGQDQLRYGAGHVPGTPLPDEEGNVCVAGHRVTMVMHPLRHMELMKPGNYVFIQYMDHLYTYETTEVFPVGNTETWVLQPVENEPHLLTLITCNPPGSARQRLILRARLIQIDGQPLGT